MNFSKKNHSLSAIGVKLKKDNRNFVSKTKITFLTLLFIFSITNIYAQISLPKSKNIGNIKLKNNQYKDLKLITENNQGYVFEETAVSKDIDNRIPNTETISKEEAGNTDLIDNYSSSLGFRAAFPRLINRLWYFFRGDYYHVWGYWKGAKEGSVLRTVRIKGGQKRWLGVPEFVTASVLHPHNNKVYFFKGSKYYRCSLKDDSLEKTGTIGISGWNGVPTYPNAALTVPEQNATYFFKGSKYYRFSYAKNRVDKIGVIGKDGWTGVPKSPDLAFKFRNGKYYFFKDEFYYRYNPKIHKVDKKELIKKGWNGLVKGIDAAFFNTTHDEVHFFNDDKMKYFPLPSGTTLVGQSNRVEINGILNKEMKTNTK